MFSWRKKKRKKNVTAKTQGIAVVNVTAKTQDIAIVNVIAIVEIAIDVKSAVAVLALEDLGEKKEKEEKEVKREQPE